MTKSAATIPTLMTPVFRAMGFNHRMGETKTHNVVQTCLLTAIYIAAALILRSATLLDWGVTPAAAEYIHAALWVAAATYAYQRRNAYLLIVLTVLLIVAQSYYALHGATYGYLTAALPLALLIVAWARPQRYQPAQLATLRVVCAAALLVMGIRISLNTMVDAGPQVLPHAIVLICIAALLAFGETRFTPTQRADTVVRGEQISRICIGVAIPLLLSAAAIASLVFV